MNAFEVTDGDGRDCGREKGEGKPRLPALVLSDGVFGLGLELGRRVQGAGRPRVGVLARAVVGDVADVPDASERGELAERVEHVFRLGRAGEGGGGRGVGGGDGDGQGGRSGDGHGEGKCGWRPEDCAGQCGLSADGCSR